MAAPTIAPPQRFVQEGLFLAIPTGVPGWCAPLPPDECRITRLTQGPRCIYGVTAAPNPHVLAADYHGSVCYVRSLGPITDANSLTGVVVTVDEQGRDRLFVAANTSAGCLLMSTINHATDDVIQEPSFWSPPCKQVVPPLQETARDLCILGSDKIAVLMDHGVHIADLKADAWTTTDAPAPAEPRRFLFTEKDQAWYADAESRIWQLTELEARRTALKLPGKLQTIGGARNPDAVPVVTADGTILLLDLVSGSSKPAGHSPLPRVQILCIVPDGRIFGLCGDGIGAFFCIDPQTSQCIILGAVVATVGTRRYGFVFSCAIPGLDGEVILGEHDRGGHLWLYYPRQPQA